MLTHYNVVSNALMMRSWFPSLETAKETLLAVLPSVHVYGVPLAMNAGLLLAAAMGIKAPAVLAAAALTVWLWRRAGPRAASLLAATAAVPVIAGYAVFGLHPQLIGSNPGMARTYALAMVGFPRVHIALGFLAVAACLSRGVRRRWIVNVAALYPASLACELLGTSVGWPFGAYRYTDALGSKWFGLVPLLIPLSWCTMTIVAFAIAMASTQQRAKFDRGEDGEEQSEEPVGDEVAVGGDVV